MKLNGLQFRFHYVAALWKARWIWTPDMIRQEVFPPHGETTEAKTKMHELPRLTLKSLGVLTWIRICHQPSWWWRWQQTTGIHLNAWGLGLRGTLKPVGNPNLTKMQDMQGKHDKNVEREWHFGLGLNIGLCKASFCNPLYLFIHFVSFVFLVKSNYLACWCLYREASGYCWLVCFLRGHGSCMVANVVPLSRLSTLLMHAGT